MRRGLALVEVLVAAAVLAALAGGMLALQSGTVRTATGERALQVERALLADLLERFAYHRSDLSSEVTGDGPFPRVRRVPLEVALDWIFLPREQGREWARALATAGARGVQLTWDRKGAVDMLRVEVLEGPGGPASRAAFRCFLPGEV